MVNGSHRAYVSRPPPARMILFMEMPAEDPEAAEGEVGWLNASLFGTRDAARSWEDPLSEHLEQNDFIRGKGYPSAFHDRHRRIMVFVHGGDYVSAGPAHGLRCPRGEFERRYKLKSQVLDGESADGDGVKVLNRMIRHTSRGFEL